MACGALLGSRRCAAASLKGGYGSLGGLVALSEVGGEKSFCLISQGAAASARGGRCADGMVWLSVLLLLVHQC